MLTRGWSGDLNMHCKLSRKDLPVYGAMIGFRNRVAHGYQEVAPERVYEIARSELGDFEKFTR